MSAIAARAGDASLFGTSEQKTVRSPAELSPAARVFAFAVMCVGLFIALLDIQIVSASLRDIGGGLSAGAG